MLDIYWFYNRVGKYICYKSIFNRSWESIRISNKKKAFLFYYSQRNAIAKYKNHPQEKYKQN